MRRRPRRRFDLTESGGRIVAEKFADRVHELFSKILQFGAADAVDEEKIVGSRRLEARHIDERFVGEDDVGRDAFGGGDRGAEFSERFKELAIERVERGFVVRGDRGAENGRGARGLQRFDRRAAGVGGRLSRPA